jgi:crotonobetainyl-CoA:carnitine CoA-transferase CaiB-like acyl-CoA transferase
MAALARLVATADVVVEASRPRALEQLGIRARDLLAAGDGPWVWVSITGYGRAAPARDWVGFGDDAAVAGGLVVWDERGPCFCADAVADPTTGLAAAAATLMALRNGGRWLLDVSLAGTAAWLAGPTQALPVWLVPAPPRARDVVDRAHPLGSDTDRVLSALE